MRKKIKLCITMLTTTVALAIFSDFGNNVYATDTPNVSQENDESVEAETTSFPSSLDLSKTKYFPGIGNQEHNGSCFFYATFYLNISHANNLARDQAASLDNTLNPMFGFKYEPLLDIGSYAAVEQIGFATLGAVELDQNEYKSLHPTKEAWESALLNRPAQMQSLNNFGTEDNIVTCPTDTSLNQIKGTLNEGLLVSSGVLVGTWNITTITTGEYKGEEAVDRCDGPYGGGHVVVFVGYDDNIWIDINHDGKAQEAEYGAFKVANSWGTDWANDGFIWLAYDALNIKSQVITDEDEIRINNAIDAGTIKANKVNNSGRLSCFMFDTYTRVQAREKATSNCWVYMTVNTGSRREMTMSVKATHKKTGESKSYQFPKLVKETENLAWDGSEHSTDGTMVFDLDNVISDITPETMENYIWEVTFEDDTLDEYSLTVKDVYFTVNGVKKYITTVSALPLNGSNRTYKMNLRSLSYKGDAVIKEENDSNVVIYYSNSSYEDANIHYRVGSGTWTTAPGVQMCVDDSQEGYTWKFVVNLGTDSKLTACFNNGDGTWDNNNSSDYTITGAGYYGIKNGKVTKLEVVEELPDPVIELDKKNVSMYVGDKATLVADVWPSYATELSITWTSSNTSVATVKDGVITGISAGTATVTATLAEGVTATVNVTVSVNNTLSGLCKANDGNWYYYNKGQVDTTYTGMAKNKYGWWYVKAGKLDLTYTGLAKNKYGWWYIKNGKLDLTYTGLANNKYGWWYIKEGKLDRTYTGMATNSKGTWYMNKGKLDTSVTGLTKTNIGWVYLTKGKLDTKVTGLVKNSKGWWYVKGGKLDFTYTGMVKNKNGWWHVNNGKLDFTYTGISTNQYGWWYMKNGKLDLTYTGKAKYNGVTYNVVNGKVVK